MVYIAIHQPECQTGCHPARLQALEVVAVLVTTLNVPTIVEKVHVFLPSALQRMTQMQMG